MTGEAIDRAAHRRTDPDWLATAWPKARVFVVDGGRVLVRDDALVFLAPEDAPDGVRLFLGEDTDGTPYFAVCAPLPEVEGATPAAVREIGHRLDPRDFTLLVTSASLSNWHSSHAYSPRSGVTTEVRDGGWMRVSGDDGTQLFPRTDPAVIVLVTDGVPGEDGRALLARGATWPERRYACVAGFVEPGESAEQAVAREVAEEVGLTLTDVRYFGSQAWPYPSQLMLGFTAVADPSTPLRLDPAEIADARWWTRAEVRAAAAWDHPGDAPLKISPSSSIAYHLITTWLG